MASEVSEGVVVYVRFIDTNTDILSYIKRTRGQPDEEI